MSLRPRGLALRNVVVEKTNTKKEPQKVLRAQVAKNTGPKSQATKLPFTIYQDPISPRCHHCGTEKCPTKSDTAKKSVSVEVQASETDLHSWLCSDDPPKEYWQSLAEQRRVALKETLDENMELCSLVEKLNAEIDRLTKIAEHAEHFNKMYQMVKEESFVSVRKQVKPRRSI